MNQENMTPEIRKLIQLYFEGLTSIEEERQLREALADPSVRGAEADEVRAVMSFAAVSPDQSESPTVARRPPRHLSALLSAAASVAVVGLLCWNFFLREPQTQYMAYIDGHSTEDPEQVMKLINDDLSLLGEASEDVADEIDDNLSAFSSVINNSEL